MRSLQRFFATSLAIAVLSSCGGDGNGGPQPLDITASSPPAGTTGTAYAGYMFAATGGTSPLSWTASGSLPPGLTLSASGQLSGMPATGGTYGFSVTVGDSSMPPLTMSVPVSFKVNDSAITVTPASPPAGAVNYAYSGFTFSASGGSPPYTWAPGGTLPPGLTLGTDGTLSGTPTQIGTFSFSVTPTDSAQTPVPGPTLPVTVMINAAPPLVLNASPAPPPGVDGTDYGTFNFNATGGLLPLHWSISAGSLPAGLTLDPNAGSLSGTPTSLGTSNFTVMVADSAQMPAQSSVAFSVTIGAPPPPLIAYSEPPTATVGAAYSPFQFSASGGLGQLTWSETPPLTIGLTLSTDGTLSGTPNANAAGWYPIALNATDTLNQHAAARPVVVRVSLPHSGSFAALAAHLTLPRSGHTATLLNSGKVLITGGGNGVADTSAELYDSAIGTFAATAGAMTEARIDHTATLLNDGQVLIVGPGPSSLTAELYDPASETFKATGSMHHSRSSFTATLLARSGPNAGKVLIAGGNTVTFSERVAELYDPATRTFSDTGSTTILRSGHSATLLTVGALASQVLIAGGTDEGGSDSATAELYDPATGTFTATTSMTVPRSGHTATALGAQDLDQNGEVLMVGADGSTDLFDPGTQKFTAVGSVAPPLAVGITSHTATLRNDGTVLVAGGYAQVRTYRRYGLPWHFYCFPGATLPRSTGRSALFAPESDGFTPTTNYLNTARDGHTATVLGDGSVLIVGGVEHQLGFSSCLATGPPHSTTTVLSSAELFR
jgi:hypothetical protein